MVVPSFQYTHYPNENDTIVVESIEPCHLFGDSDIYGIGIRLSLYVQWGACVLAILRGVNSELKSARRGICIVSTAVLINTMISTLNGSFAVLEWFIVSCLMILFPIYFVMPVPGLKVEWQALDKETQKAHLAAMVKEIRRESKGLTQNESSWALYKQLLDLDDFRDDPIGIGYLLLINTFFFIIQPWLYFSLLYQGSKSECPVKIFVFYTPIDVFNHSWVVFLKVNAILNILTCWVLCFPAYWCFKYGFRNAMMGKVRKLSEVDQLAFSIYDCHRREFPPLLKERRLLFQRQLVNCILVIFIDASLVAFVEKTIVINNIDMSNAPLSSASQLISLLVGIFSSVATCWEVLKKWREEKREEENQNHQPLEIAEMREVGETGGLDPGEDHDENGRLLHGHFEDVDIV